MSTEPLSDELYDQSASTDAEIAKAQEEADWKWLMADPRGRRIVRGLLERSGVWRTSFTGEALSSAFAEGERNAGLRLLGLVQRHAPEKMAGIVIGKDVYEPRS